jgi:4-hydroxy-3-polyprenylbenzoate decarboxylase
MRKRLIVGVAGASGSALALETLRQLAAADIETHLVISDGARATIAHELGADGIVQFTAIAEHVHQARNLGAPIASGSFRTDGTIVVPPPVPPFDARPLSMDDIIREIAARLVNWAGVDPGERMTRWSGDS